MRRLEVIWQWRDVGAILLPLFPSKAGRVDVAVRSMVAKTGIGPTYLVVSIYQKCSECRRENR